MRFAYVFLAGIVLLYFGTFGFAQDVTILDHGGAVQSVAFSPVDNAVVASAGGHDTINLWDLRSDTAKTLRGHKDKVNSVAFSPNGRVLVSGSDDSTLKVWDVSVWQNIETRAPMTLQMPFPFFATVEYLDGHDLSILGCKSLDGSSAVVEFPTTEVPLMADSTPLPVKMDSVTLWVIDVHGNFTHTEFQIHPPEDLNMDGTVNIQDLVLVASHFGQQGENGGDVNGDGIVNISDLVLIAQALGSNTAALSAWNGVP